MLNRIENQNIEFNNIEPEFRWDSGLWVEFDFNKKKNNKYQKQLDFYTDMLTKLGYIVVDTRLLWL